MISQNKCLVQLFSLKFKFEYGKNLIFILIIIYVDQWFQMCITANYEKFLKRWEYMTTLSVSWETCMQVKKQQLELVMEQQTGSKLEKEYIKAVCSHHAYLTSM